MIKLVERKCLVSKAFQVHSKFPEAATNFPAGSSLLCLAFITQPILDPPRDVPMGARASPKGAGSQLLEINIQ